VEFPVKTHQKGSGGFDAQSWHCTKKNIGKPMENLLEGLK